jgi:predicted SnoaL-like aldol condensation-catalyzing enzyme
VSQNPAQAAALRVFDAINSHDLDCLGELVTDDFVDHGSPFPLPPGPDGYRQVLTFEDVFSTEDRVVLRAVAHGVGVDAVHGAGAEGGSYSMTTAHIYRTEGDRLAEHWGVRDEYGARVQLGTITAPDPAALSR